jgi:hypothetical protein
MKPYLIYFITVFIFPLFASSQTLDSSEIVELRIQDSILDATLRIEDSLWKVARKDCPYKENATICPVCHENDKVIPISYGTPDFRSLLMDKDKPKRKPFVDYIPGGCIIRPCQPSMYCKRDKIKF